MHVREPLIEIAECDITLISGHAEDHLNARSTSTFTPQLTAEATNDREEMIPIMREDRLLKEAKTTRASVRRSSYPASISTGGGRVGVNGHMWRYKAGWRAV
jgi:hypothetical protein